jgi:two-component system OmpR family sensor kinase/two-component system sensor histidine kinase QseC
MRPEVAGASGRRWSLRSRLLALAAVACAFAWIAGGAAIYYAVQREDGVLFDARLRDLAQTLLVFADHEIQEVEAERRHLPTHIETEGTVHDRYRYQIWSKEGQLLLSSDNASRERPPVPLMPLSERGWSTQVVELQMMRVIAIQSTSNRYLIQVAEPLQSRLELVHLFGRYLGIGMLLSAMALAALSLLLLRVMLRPLRDAARHIGRRGPADLSAVALTQLPEEFAPVLDAINRLLRAIDVALCSEREFVAAAAHELRTPLAGLRAQAQLAAHQRTSPQVRNQALRAVQDGVDHATHLVNQLLDLARSDALAGNSARLSTDRQAVDVRKLLGQSMSELGPPAAERGLQLKQVFEVADLWGSEFGLGLIVRNLLANAVAHARPNGQVEIGTRAERGGVVLWVADDGPGIPEPERARMFERFARGKGNDQAGCGLGLSIVKALADAHHANVDLGVSELGGLLVEVHLPAPPGTRPSAAPGFQA